MTVSLLLGLPIAEQEFVQRALQDGAPRSDYLAKFHDRSAPPSVRLSNLGNWWRRRYEGDVAAPLARLAAAAQAHSCCRVVRGARLADLEAAVAAGAEAIVVVGHWKGPEIENDDFAAPCSDAAGQRLEGIDHRLARWIVSAAAPKRGLARLLSHALPLRDALRASLDADVEGDVPAGVDRLVELAQTRRSRRRDLLDSWLSGILAPGNRLELFDGLHAKEAVAASLRGFRGIVDLTTCTSTYLGDHLFLCSRGELRTVQFPQVQEPVDLAARLTATLELVGDGYDYLAAREAVATQMNAIIGRGGDGRW